jgi:hypothetical protein
MYYMPDKFKTVVSQKEVQGKDKLDALKAKSANGEISSGHVIFWINKGEVNNVEVSEKL